MGTFWDLQRKHGNGRLLVWEGKNMSTGHSVFLSAGITTNCFRLTDRRTDGSLVVGMEYSGVAVYSGKFGFAQGIGFCSLPGLVQFSSFRFVSFGFVALTVFLFHSLCSNYHYNHTFSHVSGCIWMLINSWLWSTHRIVLHRIASHRITYK